MKELKGKVVYITGASKGIGLGVAQMLLSAGMKVAISGRNKESLEQAALLLKGGDSLLLIGSDVRNYKDEQEAIHSIVKQWGQLDVVVANAGIGVFAPIDELAVEDWHSVIETNLNGVFHTLRASIEELKRSKGYYITIASLAGVNFFAGGAAYNASKFGVVGFTQAAMLDLRKYDIKVSTIMPGSVATHFNKNQPSEKDHWKIQPEDIGELVVDLLKMNPRTLPSKIEVRPSRPDKK